VTVVKSPTEQVRELALEVRVLREHDDYQEREIRRLRDQAEEEQQAQVALEREVAVLRQQLHDHLKQVELRDSRRWSLIVALTGVLVGAVLSLASGLIVTLAK
jgi:hypothetical protein